MIWHSVLVYIYKFIIYLNLLEDDILSYPVPVCKSVIHLIPIYENNSCTTHTR